MHEILEKIGKTVVELRKLYPDAVINEIRIGKTKIRAYGKAGDNWFKIIYDLHNNKTRIYSSSRTIETALRKGLNRIKR